MRFFNSLSTLCLAFLAACPALAQDISTYVSTGAPEDWIEVQPIPETDFEQARDEQTAYLLVDVQRQYSADQNKFFVHHADRLQTPASVENNSTIAISFDPDYQTVKIHSLRIIRDGVAQDKLDLSGFSIYREEADRERLIYNGLLQVSYVVPDVRVGDILDYSYTATGKNPAYGPNFASSYQHQYSVPIQHHFLRFTAPTDTEVFISPIGDAAAPEHNSVNGIKDYRWDTWNVPAKTLDNNLPSGFTAFPTTQVSSYASWAALGRYFYPFYKVPETLSQPIKDIAADIRAEHDLPKDQLRAALDYVQREVRYLGIELGAGGYIPRDPSLVLSRRFGDCKDMTRLLNAILSELGIQSYPLLVDLDARGRVADLAPSHNAFDHVIVLAELDGKQYFLDPTRGQQLGDLDHLQQGYFEKGVVIAPDSPGMIDAVPPAPEFYADIVETFDVSNYPGTVTMTSVSTYYMYRADDMRAWFKNNGAEIVGKNFLQYYQDTYPTIKQTSEPELKVFEDEGKVSITVGYSIPDAWSLEDGEDIARFWTRASDINENLPNRVRTERTDPYAIQHPISVRQSQVLHLSGYWEIPPFLQTIQQDAFEATISEEYADHTYTRELTYRSKSDAIEPEVFSKAMADLEEISDNLWSALEYSTAVPGFLHNIDPAQYEVIYFAWLAFACLLSLVVVVIRRKHDADWKEQLTFYPVSMTKFVILSTVTLGIYQLYWIYKNWSWAHVVHKLDCAPFWRTFFAIIWNFHLFKMMGEQDRTGHSWFRRWALPLAALYVLGEVMDRISSKWMEAPTWLDALTLASIAVLFPVAAQVNKMNDDKPTLVAKNSEFGWPAIGLIVLFLPILALTLVAVFMSA